MSRVHHIHRLGENTVLHILLIVGSALPSSAQDCTGPDPVMTGQIPGVRIPSIQRLDYPFLPPAAEPVDLVLAAGPSNLYSLTGPALSAIDTEPSIGTITLQAVVIPPDQYELLPLDDFPFGVIYSETSTVARMDMSPEGNFEGLSWYWSTDRAGCADRIVAPLLVHRFDKATDAFRSSWGDDVVFVGTDLASGPASDCATGSVHLTDNRIDALSATTGSLLRDFNNSPVYSVGGISGIALDPIQDILLMTSDAQHATNDSIWGIDLYTMDRIWSFDAGRVLNAPVVRGGRLYVASLHDILAIDSASGATLWSLPAPAAWPLVSEPWAPRVPPYHDAILVQDAFGTVHLARDQGATGTWEWSTPLEEILAAASLQGPASPSARTAALRELLIELGGTAFDPGPNRKLGNVIVAAPDLDLEVVSQRVLAEEVTAKFDHLSAVRARAADAAAATRRRGSASRR